MENNEFASYDYLQKIYVDENEGAIYPNVIAKRNEQEMIFLPNSYLGLVKYPYKDIDSKKFIYECELINFNN